jgi:hypothetical protein
MVPPIPTTKIVGRTHGLGGIYRAILDDRSLLRVIGGIRGQIPIERYILRRQSLNSGKPELDSRGNKTKTWSFLQT